MKNKVTPTPEQLIEFEKFTGEKFNTEPVVFDWNYLMEIVHKIESIRNEICRYVDITITKTRCYTVAEDGEKFEEANVGSNKIQAVFLNTLYFLKWYNSQQNK